MIFLGAVSHGVNFNLIYIQTDYIFELAVIEYWVVLKCVCMQIIDKFSSGKGKKIEMKELWPAIALYKNDIWMTKIRWTHIYT